MAHPVVWLTRWTPDFAVRVTGDATFFLHAVIVRLQIVIGDWPVCAFVIQGPRLKIFGMHARPHGVVMHRAATDAVTRIKNIADGIFSILDDRRTSPFQPPRPDSRTDEIIITAIGSRFEDHNFLATNSKLCGDRATGSTRADNDCVDFFFWHRHSPHLLGGSMCAM
jgi:hypothetical protein